MTPSPGMAASSLSARLAPSLALLASGARSPHVERTFGWMVRWRRLVRDYEARLDVSEAFSHVAMGSLLLRRISH
jgi:hypothetical protein